MTADDTEKKIKHFQERAANLKGRYLIKPDNKILVVWDVWIFFLSIIVAFLVPYEVAFADPRHESVEMFILHRLTDISYISDFILQFFIMYFDDTLGKVENSWEKIAKTYIFSFGFLIDFAAAFPFNLFSSSRVFPRANIQTTYRYRVLNFTRPMKLLRCGPTPRVVIQWEINFGVKNALTTIVKQFSFFLILAHLGACVWGLLPKLAATDESNWLYEYCGNCSNPFNSAIYWSIMTLSGVGYGDIPAASHLERIFAIVFMMISAMFNANMVGAICRIRAEMNVAKAEFAEMFDNLNDFMADKNLSKVDRLKFREFFIQKGFSHIKENYYKVVLDAMSPGLQKHIVNVEEYKWLDNIACFGKPEPDATINPNDLDEWEEKVLIQRSRFLTALRRKMKLYSYPAGEIIVHVGELAQRLYVIKKGIATIRKNRLLKWSVTGRILTGKDKSWFGEDIILNHGRRHYIVQALTFVDVVYLEKKDLDLVLGEGDFPEIEDNIKKFAVKMDLRDLIVAEAVRIKNSKRATRGIAHAMRNLKVKLQVSAPGLNLQNRKTFEIPDDDDKEGIKKIFEYLDCQKEAQDPTIKSPISDVKKLGTPAINKSVPASKKPRSVIWNQLRLPCSRRSTLVKSDPEMLPQPKQRSIRSSDRSYAQYNIILEKKKIQNIRDLRDYINNKDAWEKMKLPSRIKTEIQEILSPRQLSKKLSIHDRNAKKINEINEILFRMSSKIEFIYSNSREQKKKMQSRKIN